MSKHEFTNIRVPIEEDNPSIQRDESKCIKCGMCKKVCDEDITVGKMFDLEKTCDNAICINCGQCALACPTGSITEKWEYQDVKKAIQDKDKIVIFSTSPSVRVALGEEFDMPDGSYVEGQMVALLRALGADYVFDVTFAADLTICEEASELIERITKKTAPLPQFTSCCPAWVKYVETFYPEFIPNLSSVKSPIGMQGPTIKTYFAKNSNIDPKKIVNVAVTPCTAKKYEIRREEMNDSGKYWDIEDLRDMDYVITTRELAKWAKEENIDFAHLEDSSYDSLLGRGSGAGIIFGNTGGVMEAAVRTAYCYVTNKEAPEILYNLSPVRGMEGIKEASIQIGDVTLKLAVANGTNEAKKLLDKLKNKELHYDFVEVMNCKGGCIGGGGQPKDKSFKGNALKESRIEGLYKKDKKVPVRLSHENPEIKQVYKEFYKEPLSQISHDLLHTTYTDRSKELEVCALNK